MDTQWEFKGVTRVHTRRRVSLVVQVLDDFTGRPVTGSDVQVGAAQILSGPVRKGEGYFVFMDSPESELDVTVRSWFYHSTTVRVDLRPLSARNPVVKVRLTPNRRYPIPAHTTCLDGRAPVGSTIQVCCENDPKPLRLLYDYPCIGPEEGRLIQLYDPEQRDLEGRSFVLFRKGDSYQEFFTVQRTGTEPGSCLMTGPLSRDWKKAGTIVLPLMCVQTGENGTFFLPMQTMGGKSCRCRIRCLKPDGTIQEQAVELESGKVTQIDLTEG